MDVQDINDNAPIFEHDTYGASVLESDAVKTKVSRCDGFKINLDMFQKQFFLMTSLISKTGISFLFSEKLFRLKNWSINFIIIR